MTVGLIYSDEFLRYDFGGAHPLNQIRLKLAFELIKAYGMTDRDDVKVFKPPVADEDDLLLVHDKDYVNYVKALSTSPDRDVYIHGFGPGDNPAFKDVYESDLIHVGGTIKASELVMSGEVRHAFSLGGGYHHALPERASGFCVFNDPAVAIRHIQNKYKLKKVLYIDIDAHHGDGVQWIFYSDPSVMTISLHESGRYLFPGTGMIDEIGKDDARGTKVNIPFPMDATDNAYIYAFEEVVVPIVRKFKPEFMVCQCGGDAHYMDPLTHLALTTRGYSSISKMYRELADEVMDGRYICVTGGGYDALACARSWTAMFAEMIGFEPRNDIPGNFAAFCKKTLGFDPPETLHDEGKIVEDESRIMAFTERVVAELKKKVFPFHGL